MSSSELSVVPGMRITVEKVSLLITCHHPSSLPPHCCRWITRRCGIMPLLTIKRAGFLSIARDHDNCLMVSHSSLSSHLHSYLPQVNSSPALSNDSERVATLSHLLPPPPPRLPLPCLLPLLLVQGREEKEGWGWERERQALSISLESGSVRKATP